MPEIGEKWRKNKENACKNDEREKMYTCLALEHQNRINWNSFPINF